MKFVCQSKRRNNLRAACDGIFSFLSGRWEGKKRKNFVDWTKWPRYEKEACVTARALVWYKHIHFSWSRAEDGPRRAHARDRAIVMTFSRIVAFLFLLPPYMCTGLSLSPPPWFLIAAVGEKGWDSSSSVTCVCNALVRLFLHFSSRLIYFVCFLFLLILSPFRVCCSQKFVTVCGQPSVSAAIRSGPLRLNGAAVNVKMRVEE